MTATSLRVLGPVELDGPDGTVAVTGAKARQVLTLLAVHSPAQVSLDQIADLLWDEPPPSATKTIQSHVSRLRGALATAGAPDALTGTGIGYRLAFDEDEDGDGNRDGNRDEGKDGRGDGGLDVRLVERLTRQGHEARASGDAGLALASFARARAQWRGPIEAPSTAAGDALRRRLADERLELTIAHLGALIDSGAPGLAVAELGELTVAEPYDERVCLLHMTALHRSGRSTDALRAAHELTTRLADEVGVTAGPELRDLEARILAHDEATGTLATPTVGAAERAVPVDGGVRYTDRSGPHLAYRTFGAGDDVVLLCHPGLISIDAITEHPLPAGALARLAERHRVVTFDPRGIGLSDRAQAPETITLEQWAHDAEAVLEAAGADAAHVFAAGHGGLTGLTLAATRPERVRSLVMMNAFARATTAPDYPPGLPPALRDALGSTLRPTAAAKADALTLISPSVAADAGYRDWWDAAGRRAAGPAAAAVLMAMMIDADVRALVADVVCPTLVIARTRCPVYDPAHGRWLADHLPHATLAEQDGIDDPWWVGRSDLVIAAIEELVDRVAESEPAGGRSQPDRS